MYDLTYDIVPTNKNFRSSDKSFRSSDKSFRSSLAQRSKITLTKEVGRFPKGRKNNRSPVVSA